MWTGRMIFGMVDRCPGKFCTATEFTHIAFIPIYPHQSWLILANSVFDTDTASDNFTVSWQGVPIALSWNSILHAWGRAILYLVIAIGALSLLLSSLPIVAGNPWWKWTISSVAVIVIPAYILMILRPGIISDKEEIDKKIKILKVKFGDDLFKGAD